MNITQMNVIVDEQDNVIGAKERGTLTSSDIYRVSALWITGNAGDRILLARRSHAKLNDPGKWEPAVAGTVEEGETYDANIKKEAAEELGLENVAPTLGPKQRVTGEHNYFIQWYLFSTDMPIEDFKVQEDEVREIAWFPKEDLIAWMQEKPEDFVASADQWKKLFLE
jgi:isopentenyldiphosphate isomerase